MKTKDISATSSATTRAGAELTDPKIAERPTVVSPVAIPVGEASEGNLEPMDIAAPREWTRPAVSTVRPFAHGGEENNFGVEAAPTDNPAFNPTAREYVVRASRLPTQVSHSTMLAENFERQGNIGPAKGGRG